VSRWFDGKQWTDRTTGKPTGRARVIDAEPTDAELELLPNGRGWHHKASDPPGVDRWFDGGSWTARTTGRPQVAYEEPVNSLFRLVPEAFAHAIPGVDVTSAYRSEACDEFWWFKTQRTVVTISLLEGVQIRITVGVAADVPYDSIVSHHLSELNRSYLKFGRIYLIGNDESGRGAILMQEILRGEAISTSFRPSVENLEQVGSTLIAQGEHLANDLVSRFNGRPFRDDEHMFLMMSS
jgi:hypothetical protein